VQIAKEKKILDILKLKQYEQYFKQLENKIQEDIVDKDIWNLHLETVRETGNTRNLLVNYKERLKLANEHIENLENNAEEYKKGIQDLTKIVQDKDVELVNYANQLRGISSLCSFKIFRLRNNSSF